MLARIVDLRYYNLGRHASIDLRLYLSFIVDLLDAADKDPTILVFPELYAFKKTEKIDRVNCWLASYFDFFTPEKYGCLIHNLRTSAKILIRGQAQASTEFYGAEFFNDFGDYDYPKGFLSDQLV